MASRKKSTWQQSKQAQLQLNFTARQLVLGGRDMKVWYHVFDNMIRLEGSPVKALNCIMQWMSGYPKKDKTIAKITIDSE